MEQKLGLLSKLGITIILLYLGGMIIAPLLFKYLQSKLSSKNKRPNVDMDVLIRRKEQMLRGANPTGQLNGFDKETKAVKKHSKAEALFREKFQELSKISEKDSAQKESLMDLKNILALLDSLQWGEGAAIKEMMARFAKIYNYRIENHQIIKIVRMALKQNIILSRNTSKLPGHHELLELFYVLLYLDILFWEIRKGKSDFCKFLARSFKVKELAIFQAFESIIWKTKLSEQQVYEKLLSNSQSSSLIEVSEDHLSDIYNKIILTNGSKNFITRKEFMALIQAEAVIFSTLSAIPPLRDKRDKAGAFTVFGLEQDANASEIKKRYKQLVVERHPDKLSTRGIPKSFEKIATENFHIIQQAYDILKKI